MGELDLFFRRTSSTTLWYEGTWGNRKEWTVSFHSNEHGYRVREINNFYTYQHLTEEKKFDDANHLVREVDLNEDIVIAWIEKGLAISIPVIGVSSNFGLDGWKEGFEYSDGWRIVRLQWWTNGIPEWKPIINWYHDFVAWLKSELDKVDGNEIQ